MEFKRFLCGLLTAMLLLGAVPAVSAAPASSQTLPVAAGRYNGAAIKADGSLWVWGDNYYGMVGNGSDLDAAAPVHIMDEVKDVSLGTYHSAAVKTDGSLWVWGWNYYGQLGVGMTGEGSAVGTPKKLMEDVDDVALGSTHSGAIKTDGSLWMWGSNSNGQIGNGKEDTYSSVPERVLENVRQVSLGAGHTAAVKTDGTLWLCGSNIHGGLGNGEEGLWANQTQFIQVMDGVAKACAANNANTTAALKTDGSLWVWGSNTNGQLGNGESNTSTSEPFELMQGVADVFVGSANMFALKTDGTLWAWGNNAHGQLGIGVTENAHTPVVVPGSYCAVFPAADHTLLAKADGSLWACGNDAGGRLGLGFGVDTDFPEPKQVMPAGSIAMSGQTPTIPVENITLDQTEATLAVGNTLTLTATVTPTDAANPTVYWTTSDSAVATVEDGVVTAIGAGEAIITATAADGGLTASCTVTVSPPTVAVTGITLDSYSARLAVGESLTLKAQVHPADATDSTVSWTSNVPTVAAVENGVVTAISPGIAEIVATTRDGGYIAVCTVQVTEPSTPTLLLGDIDGSGKKYPDNAINANDALLALRHSVKEINLADDAAMAKLDIPAGALKRANVTAAKNPKEPLTQVDASDALQILRYSVKEINSFV